MGKVPCTWEVEAQVYGRRLEHSQKTAALVLRAPECGWTLANLRQRAGKSGDCQLFYLVHKFTPAVVSAFRVAFSILIGQAAAGELPSPGGWRSFRGNESARLLPVQFFFIVENNAIFCHLYYLVRATAGSGRMFFPAACLRIKIRTNLCGLKELIIFMINFI